MSQGRESPANSGVQISFSPVLIRMEVVRVFSRLRINISINGTVTSIAVTMFLPMTVGVPSDGRHILYNARTPSLRAVSFTRNPNCYICSSRGVLARGDAEPLFTRDN